MYVPVRRSPMGDDRYYIQEPAVFTGLNSDGHVGFKGGYTNQSYITVYAVGDPDIPAPWAPPPPPTPEELYRRDVELYTRYTEEFVTATRHATYQDLYNRLAQVDELISGMKATARKNAETNSARPAYYFSARTPRRTEKLNSNLVGTEFVMGTRTGDKSANVRANMENPFKTRYMGGGKVRLMPTGIRGPVYDIEHEAYPSHRIIITSPGWTIPIFVDDTVTYVRGARPTPPPPPPPPAPLPSNNLSRNPNNRGGDPSGGGASAQPKSCTSEMGCAISGGYRKSRKSKNSKSKSRRKSRTNH